jgi:hypothetical protein
LIGKEKGEIEKGRKGESEQYKTKDKSHKTKVRSKPVTSNKQPATKLINNAD